MPHTTRALIKEICRLVAEEGVATPGATRLVKLLYLAEIEWRRSHQGASLSNLKWIFWHFGPYAMELRDIFGSEDVESFEFETGKVAKYLTFRPGELERREVTEDASRVLKSIVKRWAGVDLNLLLDYVYFETEPMEDATRGAALDFSSVSPTLKPAMPNIDDKKFRALRRNLKKRVARLNLHRAATKIPLIMLEGEEAWREDFEPLHLPEEALLKHSVDET
ncbi:DUF4065 domain-containing protein [Nitrospirales bacterium NOB]|nr:DUF4065 domain-containing protein [Nitrospira sp. NTP2]MDL1888437.1 DUF4065 domain-containing protein [Nitrospirales bacterium NOB]